MQLNVAKEKLKLEEERKQCLEQVHAEPIQLDADDNVILNTSQEETPTAAPAGMPFSWTWFHRDNRNRDPAPRICWDDRSGPQGGPGWGSGPNGGRRRGGKSTFYLFSYIHGNPSHLIRRECSSRFGWFYLLFPAGDHRWILLDCPLHCLLCHYYCRMNCDSHFICRVFWWPWRYSPSWSTLFLLSPSLWFLVWLCTLRSIILVWIWWTILLFLAICSSGFI